MAHSIAPLTEFWVLDARFGDRMCGGTAATEVFFYSKALDPDSNIDIFFALYHSFGIFIRIANINFDQSVCLGGQIGDNRKMAAKVTVLDSGFSS
jgi:hypothetical protein